MARHALELPAVGILANPASGRDVRRLVAKASVFHTAEKVNMVQRALTALGTCGVATVYMIPDRGGIAQGLRRALEAQRSVHWPEVKFLAMPIEDAAIDSVRGVDLMLEAGVTAIMVMGGDGTHRVTASRSGDMPLVALSTGTNNAFPEIREATIAGLACGLIASGAVPRTAATLRNKALRLTVNGTTKDLALVDVCVTSDYWTGARALWKPEDLTELFVTSAKVDAIGLSAIAGLVRPVDRAARHGVRMKLVPAGEGIMTVNVPIAPGLILPVGIAEIHDIQPDEIWTLATSRGVVALDGEREIEFGPDDRIEVRLAQDGPVTVDIAGAMKFATEHGLFTQRGPPLAAQVAECAKSRSPPVQGGDRGGAGSEQSNRSAQPMEE